MKKDKMILAACFVISTSVAGASVEERSVNAEIKATNDTYSDLAEILVSSGLYDSENAVLFLEQVDEVNAGRLVRILTSNQVARKESTAAQVF